MKCLTLILSTLRYLLLKIRYRYSFNCLNIHPPFCKYLLWNHDFGACDGGVYGCYGWPVFEPKIDIEQGSEEANWIPSQF